MNPPMGWVITKTNRGQRRKNKLNLRRRPIVTIKIIFGVSNE